MTLTAAKARDLLAEELYPELRLLGFAPPKRRTMKYIGKPKSPFEITLDLDPMKHWGAVLISPGIVVKWERMEEVQKGFYPKTKKRNAT